MNLVQSSTSVTHARETRRPPTSSLRTGKTALLSSHRHKPLPGTNDGCRKNTFLRRNVPPRQQWTDPRVRQLRRALLLLQWPFQPIKQLQLGLNSAKGIKHLFVDAMSSHIYCLLYSLVLGEGCWSAETMLMMCSLLACLAPTFITDGHR